MTAYWKRFKKDLPHQHGEMSRRNWGHPWHSMCSYQGKLKPAIAKCLVDALMPSSKGRLLDVFSGVGTIPLEARMGGHEAFGFDISPAAVAISRAKVEQVCWNEVDIVLSQLKHALSGSDSVKPPYSCMEKIKFNGKIADYFHKETLKEILVARNYFIQHKPVTGASALVFSALLHILHGNRPYALSRRSHPITPFAPSGPTEYRALLPRLEQKIQRLEKSSESISKVYGGSYFQDVTNDWPNEIDRVDAIITSPPFFDSTRFYSANWMRLWFAGWEFKDFKSKPNEFVDEKQKKSFSLYEDIFKQANERLKAGGYFAIHLGKSKKCDMAKEVALIGKKYLNMIDSFSENVEHCESHGIKDKGTVTHHQYLLFENRPK